jgi:hypothetical protein
VAGKSNYADKPTGDYSPVEYKIFSHDNRAFTPHGGMNGEHLIGQLAADSNGDWSWKPARDKALGGHKSPYIGGFHTFKGVPPSAAELYRTTMHQPG